MEISKIKYRMCRQNILKFEVLMWILFCTVVLVAVFWLGYLLGEYDEKLHSQLETDKKCETTYEETFNSEL